MTTITLRTMSELKEVLMLDAMEREDYEEAAKLRDIANGTYSYPKPSYPAGRDTIPPPEYV